MCNGANDDSAWKIKFRPLQNSTKRPVFAKKKSSKDISIMLLVSVKHYCRGNNGELGRVAGDVQRAAGVVRGGCSVVAT